MPGDSCVPGDNRIEDMAAQSFESPTLRALKRVIIILIID